MVPVTRLPDLCLLALFKHLPPADKMNARTVCRRWADLVPQAAQSTHTLAIFVGQHSTCMDSFEARFNQNLLGTKKIVKLLKKGDDRPMFTQWNSLMFKRLDEAIIEQIVATFGHISTLHLGLERIAPFGLDCISHLLEQWHHHLITLKVYEAFVIQREHTSIDRFFAAINAVSTLKNLHLHLASLRYGDLAVISQLEQLFVFWFMCPPRHFVAMLRRHASDSKSLRRIEYLGDGATASIREFTKLGEHLLSRFTHIAFTGSIIDSAIIGSHFINLTRLRVRPKAISFRQLLEHLSPLTQLLYLNVILDFTSIPADHQPYLFLPKLYSVKILRLSVAMRSHKELEQLQLPWTMPNIEAIDFDFSFFSKCTDCELEKFGDCYIEDHSDIAKRCFRQIFGPLKRNCSQLRVIQHNYEDFLGSAEKLLAQ